MSNEIPDDIRRLADARRAARVDHDWAEADRLKAEIEDAPAGRSSMTHAAPDSGSSEPGSPGCSWKTAGPGTARAGSVPSRLDDEPVGVASLVLIATDWPDDLERALAAIAGEVATEVEIIIVANGPSPEQETQLLGWEERAAAEAGRLRLPNGDEPTGVEIPTAPPPEPIRGFRTRSSG